MSANMTGGRKSRHYRDESDPLLGLYSDQIAATSSVRSYSNPLHSSIRPSSVLIDDSSRRCLSNMLSEIPLSPKKLFPANNNTSNTNKDDSNNVAGNNNGGDGDDDAHFPRKKKKKNGGGYRVHRVSYTAQNHVQVLFRMHGSAFPQVLPFCIANVVWALTVILLKENQIVDLTFHSSVGHSFMGLLVSFLIVSRSKISYDRFMDFRRNLATTYDACREIAQFTTVYTFQTQTASAKQWRQDVCYRTILLLRVTMDALLWSSTEREMWEEEYFKYDKIKDRSDRDGGGGDGREEGEYDNNVSEHFFRFRSLTHGRRSMIDENFRAPISFSHVLRRTIMEHPEYLGYKMAVNEYRDLLNFVTVFNEAFHEFRLKIFTQYPFPLVQMTRTFLFFWVYSIPLTLLEEYRVWSSVLIVLFVTFGFIGIEYVSIALDDPFGDDTNDVDEHGMALLVYEDIYLAIYRTDGPAAAYQLRERVLARYKQGRGLDCYRDDLKGYEFWEH